MYETKCWYSCVIDWIPFPPLDVRLFYLLSFFCISLPPDLCSPSNSTTGPTCVTDIRCTQIKHHLISSVHSHSTLVATVKDFSMGKQKNAEEENFSHFHRKFIYQLPHVIRIFSSLPHTCYILLRAATWRNKMNEFSPTRRPWIAQQPAICNSGAAAQTWQTLF